MEWKQIRAQYDRAFRAAKKQGATQKSIAVRGGLINARGVVGQNRISGIMRNRKRGPSVEIFARAVAGLGLTLSEFFADLEDRIAHGIPDDADRPAPVGSPPPPVPPGATIVYQIDERTLMRLLRRLGFDRPPTRPTKRRRGR